MRLLSILAITAFLVACGSKPPPPPKKQCDPVPTGQALTEAQCQCEGGRVTLSTGGAVEVHCEAGETEIAKAKIGDRDGWCCK